MLPKHHRLRKTTEFQQTFRKGKGGAKDGILVKVRANQGVKARVGIVVSKQVAKKAVERNRIRRILLEAMQTKMGRVRHDLDIVIVALPEFRQTKAQDAERTLQELLQKAHVFK